MSIGPRAFPKTHLSSISTVRKLGIVFSILLMSPCFAEEGEKKGFTHTFTATSEYDSKPIRLEIQMNGESAKIRTFREVNNRWTESADIFLIHGTNVKPLPYPLTIQAKNLFLGNEFATFSKKRDIFTNLEREESEIKLYFTDNSNLLHQLDWTVGGDPRPSRIRVKPLINMGRFSDFYIGTKAPFGKPFKVMVKSGLRLSNDNVTPITLFTPGENRGELWLASEDFGTVMKVGEINGDLEKMKRAVLEFPEESPGNLAKLTGFSKPIDFLAAPSPWQDSITGEKASGPKFPIMDDSNNQRLVEAKIHDEPLADAQAIGEKSEVKARIISKELLSEHEKLLRVSKENMDLVAAHTLIKLQAHSDQLIPALTDIALQPQKKSPLLDGSSDELKIRKIDRSIEAVDLLAKYAEIDPKSLKALEKLSVEAKSRSVRKRAITGIAQIKSHLPGAEFMTCFVEYLKLIESKPK